MLSSTVRGLFRKPPPPAIRQAMMQLAPVIDAAQTEHAVQIDWPASRIALSNSLWGDGFTCPGGESEILRLARPLGVSAAASLLILGVGSGGPACAVARNLGAWVTGMGHDPSLLAAATGLIARSKLERKVSLMAWDPQNPNFGAKAHHHCLALEPFLGPRPEAMLDGLARTLKPGGQLVITALATLLPLNPADPTVSRWAALEHRDPADVPASVAVGRMLGRVGFDVRIAEDISQRHMENALLGWRVMLRGLDNRTPSRAEATHLVREAELWLLRRRLIRDGRLCMMRWHAIGRSRDQDALPATNGLSTA